MGDLVSPLLELNGSPSGESYQSLAFNSAGVLHLLSRPASLVNDARFQLRTIDTSNAAILTNIDSEISDASSHGMAFDPATGTLYHADGGSLSLRDLVILDPTTGAISSIGQLGLEGGVPGLGLQNGLSALAFDPAEVPEPAAAVTMGLALAAIGVLRRRAHSH